MPGLTQKEMAWLSRIEQSIDTAWDDLTAWEKRFMEDILERFRRWGVKTQISKKQWESITRISEKIV